MPGRSPRSRRPRPAATSTEGVLAGLRREGATSDELTLLGAAAREVHRLDAAFRPYLPAVVARADPAARAGRRPAGRRGARGQRRCSPTSPGFTTFSESRPPTEVVGMLNDVLGGRRAGRSTPAAGVIEHFAGDGVMAIFNAAGDQPDHAAARGPDGAGDRRRRRGRWRTRIPGGRCSASGSTRVPRSSAAWGRDARRSFAAIGDTTNTAARLMSLGSPGDVIVGRTTWEALRGELPGSPLGEIHVKGRRHPGRGLAPRLTRRGRGPGSRRYGPRW